MPDVRETSKPVGVLTADWHLSHRAPACRAEQTTAGWYGVMAEYLGQVRDLANNLNVPTVVAGDVFDRPDNPAELVNFAIRELEQFRKGIYAVPGNHDLFHGRLEDLKRTSYWTLRESGCLVDIVQGGIEVTQLLHLHGFPHGVELTPCVGKSPNILKPEVAVLHKYAWVPGKAHPGAKADNSVYSMWREAAEYDVILSGDNHIPFLSEYRGKPSNVVWYNPGTLIRRKSDEIPHPTEVGVLDQHGPAFRVSVRRVELDTSKDKFIEGARETGSVGLDDEELLEELRTLGDSALNFSEAVRRYMDKHDTPRHVREAVTRCLEDK